MPLTPIGQAAQQLRLNPSTLRYDEDRGLVRPAERRGGRRVYRPDDLRRLAFAKLIHRLGVPLSTAGAVLNDSSEGWRGASPTRLTRFMASSPAPKRRRPDSPTP